MDHHDVAGLHVHRAGRGTPVLLIHAFPIDSGLYDEQLASPPDGFSLIAPDLPGFGGSAPRDIATMDGYADALLAFLDAERIDRCVLGGLSLGGYIAFAMLRKAASRFSGLILSDTRTGPDSEEAKKGREDTAQRAEREGSAVIIEGLVPRLLGPKTAESKPDVVAKVKRMGTNASPKGVAGALRSMASRPDSADTLKAVTVPTLILVGSDDALTPVAESEAMHAALPSSKLEIIPDVGHLASIEAPKAWGEAVGAFLRGL